MTDQPTQLPYNLDELARWNIERVLRLHHGNRTHAAKALGISVRTLQRKLRAYAVRDRRNK